MIDILKEVWYTFVLLCEGITRNGYQPSPVDDELNWSEEASDR